jgi:hypothetical protein
MTSEFVYVLSEDEDDDESTAMSGTGDGCHWAGSERAVSPKPPCAAAGAASLSSLAWKLSVMRGNGSSEAEGRDPECTWS